MNSSEISTSPKPKHLHITLAIIATGVAAGVGGWLLKWLVKMMTKLMFLDFRVIGGNWWFIITPIIGILIVGFFVRRVIKHSLELTTMQLRADIAHKDGKMAPKLTIWTLLMNALTIGAGGSAGTEGPIAFASAAAGSNIARYFKFDQQLVLVFMACGAGAGIAAIFKAPVGGFFFTLEVLKMTLTVSQLLWLATMCLIAGITAYVLSGCTTDLTVDGLMHFDFSLLPPVIVVGIFCGIYSVYYNISGAYVRRQLARIKQGWIKNLVSGLTVGIFIFMFPALYGEGYGILSDLINSDGRASAIGSIITLFTHKDLIAWSLLGIMVVKGMACYASNSGGGVAGSFAPTLFAGGVGGALISIVLNYLGIFGHVPVNAMVICGMAAMMAGAVRAPLMTVFLVVEMSHTSVLLLPIALASFLSWGISNLIYRPKDFIE